MMHNLRLTLGYLRRPRLYPELWRIARARLAGRVDSEDDRESAQRWCAEHAVGPDQALSRLGATPGVPLRERFADVFAAADERVAACPVVMGSGANLDLLHAVARPASRTAGRPWPSCSRSPPAAGG